MESIKQITQKSIFLRWLTQTEMEFHQPHTHVFDSENGIYCSRTDFEMTLGTILKCSCGCTQFFPNNRF